MADDTENLMFEHLKHFQAGQDRIEKKLDEVVSRLEENDAIMSDDALQYERRHGCVSLESLVSRFLIKDRSPR